MRNIHILQQSTLHDAVHRTGPFRYRSGRRDHIPRSQSISHALERASEGVLDSAQYRKDTANVPRDRSNLLHVRRPEFHIRSSL